METKACRTCGTTKPTGDFYAQPNCKDGRMAVCKECHKERVRRRRAENIDAVREYDRRRSKEPHRKAHLRRTSYRRRKESPNMARAHRMVSYHTRKGNLSRKPCEVCGREDSHAHHDDYSKPLDVIWLCPVHHKERHAMLDARGHDYNHGDSEVRQRAN